MENRETNIKRKETNVTVNRCWFSIRQTRRNAAAAAAENSAFLFVLFCFVLLDIKSTEGKVDEAIVYFLVIRIDGGQKTRSIHPSLIFQVVMLRVADYSKKSKEKFRRRQ
jgi:hypothetical protein